MTDQNSQFFAILTAVGEAKQANANALGVPWTFAQMGVGDANLTDPIPSRTQTRLINECRRAPLNQVKVDPANASIIIAEQVIPPDAGGWWIREIGLYDAAGDLVAVANCAPSFKPLLSQGTGKTQVVRLNIIVTSTANVQLKIDPAVVLATREYVDSAILNVLPRNKPSGTYTQVQINERGIVVGGWNPTTLAGYGIIDALQVGVVSTQRPVLAASTPGDTLEDAALVIREAKGGILVQHDETYAPSVSFFWYGVAAGKLVMSSYGDLLWRGQKIITTLEQDLMTLEIQKKAPLNSPNLTGTPGAPTAPLGSRNKQIANTEYVLAAFDALIAAAPGALDTLAELAAALGNDPNFAATVTNELAKKANKSTTLEGYGIVDALQVGVVSTQRPVLAASTPGDTLEDAALVIREAKGGILVQHDETYAPSVSFFWYGVAAGKLLMSSHGDLTWRGQKIITTLEQDLMTLEIQKKAPLDSPNLTGTPGAPTAPLGSRSKQIANTEYVLAAVDALIAAAPGALDTLAELAAALGNDPSFAATITNELAKKANKSTTLEGYGIVDALRVGSVSWQRPYLASPTVGETLSDAGAVIREAREVGVAQESDSYAPAIGFHWAGRTAGRLIMDALGALKWGGKPVLLGKYATFAEINDGAGDESVITPFKLRWGFSFLMGGTGYIKFPPWLGGFLLQWGIASGVPKAGTAIGDSGPTRDVILPISFTGDVFRVFATMNFATMAATATGSASSAGTPGAVAISRSVIRVQNNYSGSDGEISWFAIGV